MSTSLWYYCNLIDHNEALDVVPVVQSRQSAVQIDTKTLRPTVSLVLEAVVGDELAVGRSTYVLSASIAAISLEEERAGIEHVGTELGNVRAVEAVVAKTVTHLNTVKEEIQENMNEVPAMVETAHNAIGELTRVDVAATEEKKLVLRGDVAQDPVALEEVVPQAVAADIVAPTPEGTDLDKIEDMMPGVIAESKTKFSIDKDLISEGKETSARVAKQSVEADCVDERIDAASVEKTAQASETIDASPTVEVKAANTATDNELDPELQSEKAEVLAIGTVQEAPAPKMNETLDSEIEETMVIDPDVAAKEAAESESQTSSFSFIPEQIRNNSYAISSVAVALATAITATLVARR
ncbi:unnamed protein product [Peronospora belbahrii]|uniref:Uncharacterized protein n=1 Tax=Peronospora belbahrii TaxID=622444 RepID=A0ABN8DDY7_9STRA|nr:unnamed protein product [Peronospora belbahrii]